MLGSLLNGLRSKSGSRTSLLKTFSISSTSKVGINGNLALSATNLRAFSTFKLSKKDADRFLTLQEKGSPFAVIKVGGEVVEYELDNLVNTVKKLNELKLTSILIHGGGPQLNDELKKRKVQPEYIGGHRVTDRATLEIAKDVFSGLNKRVVERLQKEGVKAEGFPVGVFGAELATPELGFVGEIKKTNVDKVKECIQNGVVPVLTSLGTRIHDGETFEQALAKPDLMATDNVLNINADVAAREIALELNPVKVVFTSSKGGWIDEDTGNMVNEVNLESEYIKLVNKDYTGRQGTLLKLIEIKLLLDNLPPQSSVSITSSSGIFENLLPSKGKKKSGTTFMNKPVEQQDVDTNMMMPTKFTVYAGLLGARGYVGKEWCKLLLNHSELELRVASSRQLENQQVAQGFSLEENYANNRGISKNLIFSNVGVNDITQVTKDNDIHVWVLALPNGLAAPYVHALKDNKDVCLIDLSADYRFDATGEWTYGMPERLNTRELLSGAKRISNPGCYATGTQMALMPLMLPRADRGTGMTNIKLKAGTVPTSFGVSGFSGAGTTPSRNNDPEFLSNNLVPYKLTGHIHEKECSKYLQGRVDFTPHVGQFFQGISLTVSGYLEKVNVAGQERYPTREEVIAWYEEYYKGEELVRVNTADTKDIPTVKDIMLKHHVELCGFEVNKETGRVVIVSLIDNLLKGAATQAMQNINLALGMRELDGIDADF